MAVRAKVKKKTNEELVAMESVFQPDIEKENVIVESAGKLAQEALLEIAKPYQRAGRMVGFLISSKDDFITCKTALKQVIRQGIDDREHLCEVLRARIREQEKLIVELREAMGAIVKQRDSAVERLAEVREAYDEAVQEEVAKRIAKKSKQTKFKVLDDVLHIVSNYMRTLRPSEAEELDIMLHRYAQQFEAYNRRDRDGTSYWNYVTAQNGSDFTIVEYDDEY